MEFLNKVFEQRDKPISDSSKKLYTRNLMKLNNDQANLKNKNYDVHFLKSFYNEPIEKSQEITRILNKIFGKNIGSSMLRKFISQISMVAW